MMKIGLLSAVLLFAGMGMAAAPSVQWELTEKGVGNLPSYETESYKRGLLIPLVEHHAATKNPFPEAERAGHLDAVEVPTVEFFSNSNAANPTERLPVILIAPGGGYSCLAYQKEGVRVHARAFTLYIGGRGRVSQWEVKYCRMQK